MKRYNIRPFWGFWLGLAMLWLPSLFLSVSLAAAGHDSEDWRGLHRILEDFEEATRWTPRRVEQIAGAYLPSKYDVVRRFIMRRIVAARKLEADLDADKEYTDWHALNALIGDWLTSIGLEQPDVTGAA